MVKIVNLTEDLPLPSYETAGSAGMDCRANVKEWVTIYPNETKLIPLGFKIELPIEMEAQIRGRSGLALKKSVFVNLGTIDSDYRGEVGAIVHNASEEPFHVRRGDRIAQMVFHKVEQVTFLVTDKLSDTERGEGGFGHTGQN